MLQAIVASIAALTSVAAASSNTLQKDADAILDTGAVGVQARVGARTVTSGVADLKTGRKVDPDGEFRIASSSKTFTAVVVMQLVGEGRLSLNDSVESLLPGVVRGNGNDGRRITVRNLLQHTSGIHDDIPGFETPAAYYEHRYDVYTTAELVARAMQHKPDFQPGKGWGYSNTGYLLLGMIVERVTGNPAYEEMKRRIIEPLGLSRTYWPGLRKGLRGSYAHGYQRYADGVLVDVTRNRVGYWAGAAGGLVSTTADLDRFYRALLGGRLVRPAQLAQMKQTVPVSKELEEIWPGARDGLGLFSRPLDCGGVSWGHSGDIEGYMTRDGFTGDGRRGVVVSVSTSRNDSFEGLVAQDRAAAKLVDDALCAD